MDRIQSQVYGAPGGSAELITLGQLQILYLRDGASEGRMGAFELVVPPNSNVPPPHSHAHNEEVVFVLEGKLRYSVNAEVKDLSAGESAFTPKGAVHGFSNPFSVPSRSLVVLSPDIGAQYFRDIAAVLGAGGPPDRAKVMKIMEAYGLKPAAPAGSAPSKLP
ncbi:MAG: cupin domain-containing protein [Acidobacteria bacterium]|nr:cupin domain-containing protein [Acidobacteriota bacterium]